MRAPGSSSHADSQLPVRLTVIPFTPCRSGSPAGSLSGSGSVACESDLLQGRLAQLARAPPLQGGGRGFESLSAHHLRFSLPRRGHTASTAPN